MLHVCWEESQNSRELEVPFFGERLPLVHGLYSTFCTLNLGLPIMVSNFILVGPSNTVAYLLVAGISDSAMILSCVRNFLCYL